MIVHSNEVNSISNCSAAEEDGATVIAADESNSPSRSSLPLFFRIHRKYELEYKLQLSLNPLGVFDEVRSDCAELITLLAEYSPESNAERASSPGSLLGGQRRGKLNAVHILMSYNSFLRHFSEKCQKLEESEHALESFVSSFSLPARESMYSVVKSSSSQEKVSELLSEGERLLKDLQRLNNQLHDAQSERCSKYRYLANVRQQLENASEKLSAEFQQQNNSLSSANPSSGSIPIASSNSNSNSSSGWNSPAVASRSSNFQNNRSAVVITSSPVVSRGNNNSSGTNNSSTAPSRPDSTEIRNAFQSLGKQLGDLVIACDELSQTITNIQRRVYDIETARNDYESLLKRLRLAVSVASRKSPIRTAANVSPRAASSTGDESPVHQRTSPLPSPSVECSISPSSSFSNPSSILQSPAAPPSSSLPATSIPNQTQNSSSSSSTTPLAPNTSSIQNAPKAVATNSTASSSSAVANTNALLSGSKVVLKSSWMIKKGEVVKNWKRRFAVLYSTLELSYFEAENLKQTAKGTIDLRTVTAVRASNEKSKPNCIDLVTSSRVYVLSFATPELMQEWIDALHTKIKKV